MKAKKARKRLRRVEGLLTGVLDGCTKSGDGVHDLLDNARSAVSDAILRLQKTEFGSRRREPPSRSLRALTFLASATARQISLRSRVRILESALSP
jgi:hypothetical protein